MHTETDSSLTAHVGHLFRADHEARQMGASLGSSDFLVDRTREEWHRIHLRMDDGRQAQVWYKRDGERQLVTVRTDGTTYPEVSNKDMPALVAGILRDLVDSQLAAHSLQLPADSLDSKPIEPVSQA